VFFFGNVINQFEFFTRGKTRTTENTHRHCVYYESMKRKVKTKYICGCRCYERLQPDTKEFTRLAYTELIDGCRCDERLNAKTDGSKLSLLCFFFSSNVESFKRDETAGEGAAAGRQEPGS
jgi:hypothetical protein